MGMNRRSRSEPKRSPAAPKNASSPSSLQLPNDVSRSALCSARSLYVHVPFCAHRCGYCNFTLVAGRDDLMERYLQAIELELEQFDGSHEVDTLFFGGGTPTHLPTASLERLLHAVGRRFPLAPGGEWTVEANPIDVNREKVDLLGDHGVTRISLGVQSFDARKLAILERDHSPDDVIQAVSFARRRIANVSLDLIFGAPGESLDSWRTDLSTALSLVPQHVSTYGLTWEKGTSFWARRGRNELQQIDEDVEAAMYGEAIDQLASAGFDHYETSNFARPGFRCRHNETYWLGESYHAVGPGAARYIDGRRETNHRSTTTYINRVLSGQSPVAESETLSLEDRARELLVFALRRLEGVDRDWFRSRTGFSIDWLVGESLGRHVEHGWMSDDGSRIRLTRSGLLLSDGIWPDYLRR
jgi:oxygen-independent coproporphyrinogen-3 oxidase